MYLWWISTIWFEFILYMVLCKDRIYTHYSQCYIIDNSYLLSFLKNQLHKRGWEDWSQLWFLEISSICLYFSCYSSFRHYVFETLRILWIICNILNLASPNYIQLFLSNKRKFLNMGFASNDFIRWLQLYITIAASIESIRLKTVTSHLKTRVLHRDWLDYFTILCLITLKKYENEIQIKFRRHKFIQKIRLNKIWCLENGIGCGRWR